MGLCEGSILYNCSTNYMLVLHLMVYKWFVTAQQIQPDTDLVVEIDLIMGKITLLCSCSPHTLSMTKSICCSVFLRHHVIHEFNCTLGKWMALVVLCKLELQSGCNSRAQAIQTIYDVLDYNIKGNLIHNYKHIFWNIWDRKAQDKCTSLIAHESNVSLNV